MSDPDAILHVLTILRYAGDKQLARRLTHALYQDDPNIKRTIIRFFYGGIEIST